MDNQAPRTWRVQDRYDEVQFTGVRLAAVSTETPEATRWTEIEIYRTEAGRYVIHRVGQSVLYHRPDGPCNTGVPVRVRDLDDDMEMCDRCWPGQELVHAVDPDDEVMQELDKHSVDVCEVGEVYGKLLLHRPTGTFMSQPAQRALAEAREADPDLRAATSAIRHVG